jgi:hypothetical protein
MGGSNECPKCGSPDLLQRKKKAQYIREDCGRRGEAESVVAPKRIFSLLFRSAASGGLTCKTTSAIVTERLPSRISDSG